MFIKKPQDLTENDVTPRSAYLNRRQIMQAAGGLALTGLVPGVWATPPAAPGWLAGRVASAGDTPTVTTDESLTAREAATRYNNFYEFGTGKDDPAKHADEFNPYPWEVAVGGECDNPGTLGLEDLLTDRRVEERIYRLRCVEAWSMVIPWAGVELGPLLQRFQPNANAKYVAFETVYRPEEMRDQGSFFSSIDYPYVEGLRMDEAMHPLAFLAIGMYGEALPNQNGAPIRLLVPWKYGFKSIKSIVKINFVKEPPATTWNLASPNEYGFYSNVNPNVDHPRWSQAKERRITSDGNVKRVPTAMFNGYTEVASLYKGMDLRKFF